MSFANIIKFSRIIASVSKNILVAPAIRPSAFKVTSLPTFSLIFAHCNSKLAPGAEEWDNKGFEHEFLIKQACTININGASQLLTVIIVAIQDASQRLRAEIVEEMHLIRLAMEWGDNNTSSEHWDHLVEVRHRLATMKYNMQVLTNYLEYAGKLATAAAEVSYLTGNTVASDAICERIEHAFRASRGEEELNNQMLAENLRMHHDAIVNSPHLEGILKQDEEHRGPSLKKCADLSDDLVLKHI